MTRGRTTGLDLFSHLVTAEGRVARSTLCGPIELGEAAGLRTVPGVPSSVPGDGRA
jgi:hypothetical protein